MHWTRVGALSLRRETRIVRINSTVSDYRSGVRIQFSSGIAILLVDPRYNESTKRRPEVRSYSSVNLSGWNPSSEADYDDPLLICRAIRLEREKFSPLIPRRCRILHVDLHCDVETESPIELWGSMFRIDVEANDARIYLCAAITERFMVESA